MTRKKRRRRDSLNLGWTSTKLKSFSLSLYFSFFFVITSTKRTKFRWLWRTVCPRVEITSVPSAVSRGTRVIDRYEAAKYRTVTSRGVQWIRALMEAFSVRVNIYRKCILISWTSLNTTPTINHNALCIHPGPRRRCCDAQGRCTIEALFILNNWPRRKWPPSGSRRPRSTGRFR